MLQKEGALKGLDDDIGEDDADTKDDDNDDDNNDELVRVVMTTADGRIAVQQMTHAEGAALGSVTQQLARAYHDAVQTALEQGASAEDAKVAGWRGQAAARDNLDPALRRKMEAIESNSGVLISSAIPALDGDRSVPVGTFVRHSVDPTFSAIFSHGGGGDLQHPLVGRVRTLSEVATTFEDGDTYPWQQMLSTGGYLAQDDATPEQRMAADFYKALPDSFFGHGEWLGDKVHWNTEEEWKDKYKPTLVFDTDHFPTSMSIPLLCIHRVAHESSRARYLELEECASSNEAANIGATTFWVLPQSRTPVPEAVALAHCLAGKEAFLDAMSRKKDIQRLPMLLQEALQHYNLAATSELSGFVDVFEGDFDPETRRQRALVRAKGSQPHFVIPVSMTVDSRVPGYRREVFAVADKHRPLDKFASTVEGWAHTLASELVYRVHKPGLHDDQMSRLPCFQPAKFDVGPPLATGDSVYLHSTPSSEANGHLATVVRYLGSEKLFSGRCVVRVETGAWVGKCFAVPWLFLGRAYRLDEGDRLRGTPASEVPVGLPFDVELVDGWKTFPQMDDALWPSQSPFEQLDVLEDFTNSLDQNPNTTAFFHRRADDDENFKLVAGISHESAHQNAAMYRWVAFRGKAVIKGFAETNDQIARRVSLMISPQHSICECCKTPISTHASDVEADRWVVPLVCGHVFHEKCLAPYLEVVGRGACPVCHVISSNIFGRGDRCYSCPGFEFGPPLVELPRFYAGQLGDAEAIFKAVDGDEEGISVDAADAPPPTPPPKNSNPKKKKGKAPAPGPAPGPAPEDAALPSLNPAPMTSDELRALHDARLEDERRQAAYRRAMQREQIARERWQKAETEAAKAAAAEARRLPESQGPKQGVAGSRRVKTVEEAHKHAFWTSPEGKKIRREYDKARKETQEAAAAARRSAEEKKRLEENPSKEDKDEHNYARFKHEKRPSAPSLADAAARPLNARNLRQLSAGAGPSRLGDADAESVFGGAASVATAAWTVDFTGHARYKMGIRDISDLDVQRCLKHGQKNPQRDGRLAHLHPCWGMGTRLVVITEADGVKVVTTFDADNDR